MIRLFITLLTVASLLSSGIAQELSSPNKELKLVFSLNKTGSPIYKLFYKDKPVIAESKLGFELLEQEPLLDGFKITEYDTSSFDETWQPVWGEEKNIRNHYNELLVKLIQPSTNRKMNIRFRLFNTGLGFRYEFPEQDNFIYFIILMQFNMI